MKRILVLLAVVLVASVATARADTLNPINPVPVTINAAASGEQSVQYCLDQIFGTGVVNANTDQQGAGMWQSTTLGGLTTVPTLKFEYAGNASSNIFGIWFGNDTNPANDYQVNLLLGPANPAAPNNAATVNISGTTMYVSGYFDPITNTSNCGVDINCGSFTNPLVNAYSFGFFLQTAAGQTYYSVDQLNGSGPARMVAYDVSTTWALAFEDGTDFDYNDMVVKVESITGVPEPGSMLLLGTGLFGLAGAVRRRMKK